MAKAKVCWLVVARQILSACAVLAAHPAAASARLEAAPGDALGKGVWLDVSIRVPPLLTLRARAPGAERGGPAQRAERGVPGKTCAERIEIDGYELRSNAGALVTAHVLGAPGQAFGSEHADHRPGRLLIAATP